MEREGERETITRKEERERERERGRAREGGQSSPFLIGVSIVVVGSRGERISNLNVIVGALCGGGVDGAAPHLRAPARPCTRRPRPGGDA